MGDLQYAVEQKERNEAGNESVCHAKTGVFDNIFGFDPLVLAVKHSGNRVRAGKQHYSSAKDRAHPGEDCNVDAERRCINRSYRPANGNGGDVADECSHEDTEKDRADDEQECAVIAAEDGVKQELCTGGDAEVCVIDDGAHGQVQNHEIEDRPDDTVLGRCNQIAEGFVRSFAMNDRHRDQENEHESAVAELG